jgi:alpha-beta hydrolase superfamily lysophospholipase
MQPAGRVLDLSFQADGFNLRGTLHLPEAPRPPLVIGCHGLLSDRRSPKQVALAEACNRLGLAFFRFDHRGCGESEGRLEHVTSLESRTSDLLQAMDHLGRRTDLAKRIALFGSSMGGAVCLQTACRRDIAALVVFAAPVRSRALKAAARAPDSTPETARMAAVLKEEFDLALDLARVRNVLVFHGEADAVVPLSHAHEIFRCAAEPKRLVIQNKGDHLMSDPRQQEEFIREAALWLSKGLLQTALPR